MTEKQHILVIGGTKGIGRAVVDEALARGHHVRAFARSAGEMAARERLEPMAGTALSAEDVARALEGVDVVVEALGVDHNAAMVLREVTIFSEATKVLVPLMAARGPRRLIAVTGVGAGDSDRALSTVEKFGRNLVLGRAYADKTRQEEIIRASDLDWTILRPGILTNGARTGKAQVLTAPEAWRNGLVSRADVADCVVSAAETGAWVREAPVVVR